MVMVLVLIVLVILVDFYCSMLCSSSMVCCWGERCCRVVIKVNCIDFWFLMIVEGLVGLFVMFGSGFS